jgi:hypothetical protein
MKKRTLKTAGAAALGIAFAAAAAGPAAAAGSGIGGAADLVGSLPVGKATKHLPGAAQSTGATKTALGTTAHMIPANPTRALPVGGGLPVGQLTGGLPVGGLPTGALLGGLLG